ncbi:MAG: DUF480 domain-containing protein [Rhizobiaceae bacterium]|nr:DUF480 domain-containing protein [Rhizobiaceae bacterium]MCV0407649.1 DUF480 domain-containing protein [Rhizobiaceae bacterium]
MNDSELPLLTAPEARVLGCLIEKKETTPDVYPLSLNGAVAAANQKSSRDPVMTLEPGEVRHALTRLQEKGLARRSFASRVERYEHLMPQRFSLTGGQIALIGLMLLRGPQTAHELLTRSERMARYGSIEDVKSDLDLMIGRRPPLVVHLERGPGQREDRYTHLLAGPVEAPPPRAATAVSRQASPDVEDRLRRLEERVAELEAKLAGMAG